MRLNKLSGTAVTAVAVLLTGCAETENPIVTQVEKKQEISFDYSLSAAFSQKVYHNIAPSNTRAAENVKARMLITDENTGIVDTTNWYVTLDNDIATITSNSTTLLPPSIYSFKLLIDAGSSQYIGEANNIEIVDGDEKVIDLTVKPVIGTSQLYYEVNNLPSLTFQYQQEDISSFTDPKIGYTIDGGVEQIVDLNSNGTSDVYLNIPEGSHTLSLRLLDGNLQKAKSVTSQETIVVASGDDIVIDLIPLTGEVKVNIPIDNEQATFNFIIPSAIVTEVGGVENLKTVFQISGSKNGTLSSEVAFTPSGVQYTGSVTFPSVAYDTIAMSVTFMDKSNGDEIVATMVHDDVELNAYGAFKIDRINLVNRAIVTGDLLSTIAVNVYDTIGAPVQGASVYVNGSLVGITGEAAVFGTDGYLRFHHKKGTFTISAQHPSLGSIVSKDVTIDALGVYNIDLSSDTLTNSTTGLYALGSIADAIQQRSKAVSHIESFISRVEESFQGENVTIAGNQSVQQSGIRSARLILSTEDTNSRDNLTLLG